jgi:hypothetical protein
MPIDLGTGDRIFLWGWEISGTDRYNWHGILRLKEKTPIEEDFIRIPKKVLISPVIYGVKKNDAGSKAREMGLS